jgi:hypothetical protein
VTVHGAFRGNIRDDLGWLNTAGRPDPTQTFHRVNLPRVGLSDVAALTTAVMTSAAIYLAEGDVVSTLTFVSAGTAADTPTHQWAALYSPSGALLSQSTDKTTAAWAADTAKAFDLAAAQTITKSGLYYAALCVVATTAVPSLVGCVGAKPVLTGEANLGQTSGSALTATAPATISSPAFQAETPLVVAT